MKKNFFAVLIILLLFAQLVSVAALSSGEAKQEWQNAKTATKTAKDIYNDARIARAADPTPENKQAVVDTGKELLQSALNEAEAWLNWKNAEADEDTEIPSELKQEIKDDIAANLAKLPELRTDVDNAGNELELGLVFLKLIGKYFELLADVAKDAGKIWSFKMTLRADTAADFEASLREAANGIADNTAILAKLDQASAEISTARTNIANAESEYNLVVIPGTPLIKFANGNNYLRIAQGNLISAHGYLNQAYRLLSQAGGSSE